LAEGYEKRVKEETELTKDQLKTRYVGKLDPKKRAYSWPRWLLVWMLTLRADMEDLGQQLIEDNIVSVSRQMIDKEASVAKGGQDTNSIQNGEKAVDDDELWDWSLRMLIPTYDPDVALD